MKFVGDVPFENNYQYRRRFKQQSVDVNFKKFERHGKYDKRVVLLFLSRNLKIAVEGYSDHKHAKCPKTKNHINFQYRITHQRKRSCRTYPIKKLTLTKMEVKNTKKY